MMIADPPVRSAQKQHSVLIVDDNVTNLQVISDYLKDFGYRILVAQSGEKAIQRARYARPDLILLDVMMPGIDGFETCLQLKAAAHTSGIPVIFMTALAETEAKIRGFQVGGVDYVTKPFQHEEVLARVRMHLQLSDLTQSLKAQNLKLELSNHIGQQISALLDMESLLLEAVESIQTKFDCAAVMGWLVDTTRKYLELRALAGTVAPETYYLEQRLPLGDAAHPISATLLTAEPHQSPDGKAAPDGSVHPVLDEGYSLLALPMRAGGQIVGVLAVLGHGPGAFRPPEIHIFQSLTNQIAIGVENARLHERITRLNRHLEQEISERTGELELAYQNLEQLDRAKLDFIQIASHELRTPLTIIHGYTRLLAQEPGLRAKKDARKLLDAVMNGTRRLTDIVNTMLDVTQIESNILQASRKPVHLQGVIESVAAGFDPVLNRRQLSLSLTGLDGLPLIQGDEELLSKAFYHLIVNAIKYTPDGGNIRIGGKSHHRENVPGLVEITIQDTGIGINPDQLELIFEKFYQTTSASQHSSGRTSYKGGGPGLGLAIARGIISAHGGKVWAESEGQNEENLPGSIFYIHMPAA